MTTPCRWPTMSGTNTWQGRIVPEAVQIEHPLDGFGGNVEKGPFGAGCRVRLIAPRPIDQDVDQSQFVVDARGRLLETFFAEHVGGYGDRSASFGDDLVDDSAGGFFAEVEHGHGRSLPRPRPGSSRRRARRHRR